jgi:hypothetical protein
MFLRSIDLKSIHNKFKIHQQEMNEFLKELADSFVHHNVDEKVISKCITIVSK